MLLGYTFNELIIFSFYTYLLYILYRILYWVYKITIRKRYNLKERYGNNTWALVTGATDGIGKAFCEALAREGFNIILVSRNIDKLKKCEEELKSINPKIETFTLIYDFSNKIDLESYKKEFAKADHLDISIIVNNVGIGVPSEFINQSLEDVYNTMIVNMLPQGVITKIFIDKLVKREKKSAFINISSVACLTPIPNFAVYSATKAFNDFLSRALQVEFSGKIDFLSVRPFGVSTNLAKMKTSFTIISPRNCAESTLNQLVYENVIFGYYSHDIQATLFSYVADYFFRLINYSTLFKKLLITNGLDNKIN